MAVLTPEQYRSTATNKEKQKKQDNVILNKSFTEGSNPLVCIAAYKDIPCSKHIFILIMKRLDFPIL